MIGAIQHEQNIEITDNISMFYDKTGILCFYKQLEWLGFDMDNVCGTFEGSQADMLLEFCKNNPQYHIISVTRPGRLENRYVLGKKTYLLAAGDTNPNLILDIFWKKNAGLVAEEMLDKALTIISDINRSHQTK